MCYSFHVGGAKGSVYDLGCLSQNRLPFSKDDSKIIITSLDNLANVKRNHEEGIDDNACGFCECGSLVCIYPCAG